MLAGDSDSLMAPCLDLWRAPEHMELSCQSVMIPKQRHVDILSSTGRISAWPGGISLGTEAEVGAAVSLSQQLP